VKEDAGGLNLLKNPVVRLALEEKLEVWPPVLKINDHATGGRRTKDILGGPKGWGPKKKVANVEIYVIFEVFAFCGGRTKTDFKDRGCDRGVPGADWGLQVGNEAGWCN